MRVISFFFCILWFSVAAHAQESKTLDQVRAHFEDMDGEEAVQTLMNWPLDMSDEQVLRVKAYKAAATCVMAQYSWSPIKKLGYFKKGTRQLDRVINEEYHVESVYLRLLIQLKAPEMLNYDKNLEDDLAFLKRALPESGIDEAYKAKMIDNVNALLKERNKQEMAAVYDNMNKNLKQ